MKAIVTWIEAVFAGIPLPLLEVWGRFGYVVGFALAIAAFGGFTFRAGGKWQLGRERQAWDAKALLSIPLTFVLIVAAGYFGSFIVLVPGAQTFESLKDLVVFACIVLFGYPALLTVPFAYGLSDLIEGVPPEFLADWLPGYFINPACFWVAYQLIGRDPDFRRVRTWGGYLVFVLVFMALEPVLWGFICSEQFTSEIAYRSITPALFFTTSLTWVIAPLVMLGALPLARHFRLFWAEISDHVKERVFGRTEWVWVAGQDGARPEAGARAPGLPIRMFIVAPFIAFVLVMVGVTAYVTLRSAEDDATKLATRLHQEIADNISLRLDDYLAVSPAADAEATARLLRELPITQHGRAFIINHAGGMVASSSADNDPVVSTAISSLRQALGGLENLPSALAFRFDHVSAKPLSRETWLAQATTFANKTGGHADWIVVTAMPESYYLAGVRTGASRSAMLIALALLLALGIAVTQASLVTAGLRRIAAATRSLATGSLAERVPSSRLEELDALAQSFNDMAGQRKKSADDLRQEAETRNRAEAALRENERRYRTTLDGILEGCQLIGFDWRYLYLNDMAAQHNRRPNAELLGRIMPEMWPGIEGTRVFGLIARCMKERILAQEEVEFAFRDGTTSWFDVRVQPAEEGVLVLSVDKTQRKQAENRLIESERKYRELVEHANSIILRWDAEGRITLLNEFGQRFFGYTAEEIIGRHVLGTIVPEQESGGRDLQQLMEAICADPAAFERNVNENIRRNGSRVWISWTNRVEYDAQGRVREILSVGTDITEQRRAEQAVRELNASLERRVAERTAELYVALVRAEAADKLKSAFLATMSHELRTPLNSIIGFTGIILQGLAGPLNAEQTKQLGMVRGSARHLLELINDVLDLSKIEAGQLELRAEPLDLAAVVTHAAASVRPLAEKKGLALSTRLPSSLPPMTGDRRRVEQILLNLLNNAIKFTEHGTVTLTAEVLADFSPAAEPSAAPRPAVRLRVADTGIGIKPEDLATLFQPFRQIDSGLARQHEGTGLGLTICRRLAGLLGGEITVTSAWAKGSEFAVTLPLHNPSPTPS
jgi:PAS domain S-box-containing protein